MSLFSETSSPRRSQEALFKEAVYRDLDNSWEIVLVLDDRGFCSFANRQARLLNEQDADHYLGRHLSDFLEFNEEFDQFWSRLRLDREASAGVKIYTLKGVKVTARARARWHDGLDRFVVRFTRFVPSPDLKHTWESYVHLHRFGGVVDGLLYVYDLQLHSMTYVNRSLDSIFGYTLDEVKGQPDFFHKIVHPEDWQIVSRNISLLPTLTDDDCLEATFRVRDANLGWCRLKSKELVFRRSASGKPQEILGLLTRMPDSDLDFVEDRWRDGVTSLPNRALFVSRLERVQKHKQVDPEFSFAVLLIDVNRFKILNERFGYQVGNNILQNLAERLDNALRIQDTLARVGEDEFAVILEGVHNSAELQRVLAGIFREASSPLKIGGKKIRLSVSVGVVLAGKDYKPAEEILRQAGIALHQTKEKSRMYQIYDRHMQVELQQWMEFEQDFAAAFQKHQMRVLYQPIFDIRKQKLVGAEALVRWAHPVRGWLTPDKFITQAEEMNLISRLDQEVLQLVCKDFAHWQTKGIPQLKLSVNVSGKSIDSGRWHLKTRKILDTYGLTPDFLQFELTESVLLGTSKQTIGRLNRLRDMGITFAVDDFGTGYSSFRYLQMLPISTLKIDRSFVTNLDSQKENRAITKALINLGSELGLTTVAEGVETERQFQELRKMGCDLGQGYWYGKVLTPEDFLSLVIKHQPT